jgi:hypothetical protein
MAELSAPEQKVTAVTLHLTAPESQMLDELRGEMAPAAFILLLLKMAASGSVHGEFPWQER